MGLGGGNKLNELCDGWGVGRSLAHCFALAAANDTLRMKDFKELRLANENGGRPVGLRGVTCAVLRLLQLKC